MGYYEDLVAQLIGGGMESRDARRAGSQFESNKLNYELGSSRPKGKNERIPGGSYSLSWYPGQAMDIEMAPGRVIPADAMARMSPEQRAAWERKMREWQDMQRALVPQHGSGFIRNLMGGV